MHQVEEPAQDQLRVSVHELLLERSFDESRGSEDRGEIPQAFLRGALRDSRGGIGVRWTYDFQPIGPIERHHQTSPIQIVDQRVRLGLRELRLWVPCCITAHEARSEPLHTLKEFTKVIPRFGRCCSQSCGQRCTEIGNREFAAHSVELFTRQRRGDTLLLATTRRMVEIDEGPRRRSCSSCVNLLLPSSSKPNRSETSRTACTPITAKTGLPSRPPTPSGGTSSHTYDAPRRHRSRSGSCSAQPP